MKQNIIYAALGVTGLLLLSIIACTKQNEQTLIKQSGVQPCDTTNMSFAKDINPILQYNCVVCHNSGLSNDGVVLDNYNGVVAVVNNRYLAYVITDTPPYPNMPEGLPQLSTCTINKILAWINRGAPNN